MGFTWFKYTLSSKKFYGIGGRKWVCREPDGDNLRNLKNFLLRGGARYQTNAYRGNTKILSECFRDSIVCPSLAGRFLNGNRKVRFIDLLYADTLRAGLWGDENFHRVRLINLTSIRTNSESSRYVLMRSKFLSPSRAYIIFTLLKCPNSFWLIYQISAGFTR